MNQQIRIETNPCVELWIEFPTAGDGLVSYLDGIKVAIQETPMDFSNRFFAKHRLNRLP
jgi:hypothetical protein